MALLRAAPVERARPALVLEAHGPPRNRIHYIIVGDGYTEADLETKYVEHLEAMLESRFTAEYESARPIDSSTPAAMASGELDDHGAVMRRGLIGGALVRIAVMAFGWRAVAPMNAPVVPERTRGGVGARRGTARSGGTGLTLHSEETRLVPFFRPPLGQRRERAKSGSFDLLGFTRYWSKSRKGAWVVTRKTAKGRLARALGRMAEWCRDNRHVPVRAQRTAIVKQLRGHYGYYGITGNSRALNCFFDGVRQIWRKWLDRRSSNASFSFEALGRLLQRYPLPRPVITHRYT